MGAPIIFCHYGCSSYLFYTLYSAKLSNPKKDIILLGDSLNKNISVKLGVVHIDFTQYDSEENVLNFDHDFKFIAGENHGRKDWTKFVFKRWFYINEYLKKCFQSKQNLVKIKNKNGKNKRRVKINAIKSKIIFS
jgi:hypothetical protein